MDRPPGSTRLVLVRHGEAQASVDGVVGGPRGCRGLSVLGHRQAEALAARWARTGELDGATALVASGLQRAVETAQALAPVLGLPVEQDPQLNEHDPGEADGLTWEEFVVRFGRPDFDRDPYTPIAEGAESWAEFQLRARRALHGVAVAHEGGSVVVACHAGVIDASLRGFLGLPLWGGFQMHIPNTSITEWWWLPDETGPPCRPPQWKLVRAFDAAHLAGVDGPRLTD